MTDRQIVKIYSTDGRPGAARRVVLSVPVNGELAHDIELTCIERVEVVMDGFEIKATLTIPGRCFEAELLNHK